MYTDFLINNCINLLEEYLPQDLYRQVKPYLTVSAVDKYKGLTQTQKVEKYLFEHGDITNMKAHLYFGIRHLPARIRDLNEKLRKNNEYYVDNTEVKTACDRDGKEVRFVNYRLLKTNKGLANG